MNIDQEFPSKFLKSADLQGEAVKVKIKEVKKETLGDDEKLALYFVGKSKGMILNKTNAYAIKAVYGPDTDEWIGQTIELFAMPVEFQGRMVEGLRVRVPRPKKAERDVSGFDDEDPAPKTKAYAEASGARAKPALAEELDDEIPF